MNDNELLHHLQSVYFDNVDTARPGDAVKAFTPDVIWQHTQVWAHDGHDSRHTDRLDGQDALYAFMSDRVGEMQVIKIKHVVDEAIVSGDRGAFRARVVGPEGNSLGFVGWVELRDGLIQRYIVMPENFAA